MFVCNIFTVLAEVHTCVAMCIFFTALTGISALSKLDNTLKDVQNELKCPPVFGDVSGL